MNLPYGFHAYHTSKKDRASSRVRMNKREARLRLEAENAQKEIQLLRRYLRTYSKLVADLHKEVLQLQRSGQDLANALERFQQQDLSKRAEGSHYK